MTIMQMLLAGGARPPAEFISSSASEADDASSISIPEPSPGFSAGNLLILLAAGGNSASIESVSDSFTVRVAPVSSGELRGTAVYSRASNGAEGSISITFNQKARNSAGVVQFSNAIYAAGGTGIGDSVAIPSHTFPAGGGATAVLEQRTNVTSTAPPLIAGFTSLATGIADDQGWRLQYRMETTGASAAATSGLSDDNTVAWAHVEAG